MRAQHVLSTLYYWFYWTKYNCTEYLDISGLISWIPVVVMMLEAMVKKPGARQLWTIYFNLLILVRLLFYLEVLVIFAFLILSFNDVNK